MKRAGAKSWSELNMANGAAVALSLVLDPPPAAAAPTEIDLAIGQAAASAAVVLAAAMLAHQQNGQLDPATRERGGIALVQLSRMQLNNLDKVDFDAVARQQGMIILRQYLAAANFYQRHEAGADEQALNTIIDGVLEIAGRVVADESAFLQAMAN
jgi:hypothetical protein